MARTGATVDTQREFPLRGESLQLQCALQAPASPRVMSERCCSGVISDLLMKAAAQDGSSSDQTTSTSTAGQDLTQGA